MTQKYETMARRDLGALLRVGDRGAGAYVRAVVGRNKNAVAPAAAELRVTRKTLYAWLALDVCKDIETIDRTEAARRARVNR